MAEQPTAGKTHLIDHRAALPPDILSAWFNGEYLIGDRNTNQVKHIGFCLALQGTYRYFTLEEFEKGSVKMFRVAHYGFCRIELVEQELEFHGIRIYTNPDTWKGSEAQDKLPLWRSDFSKIWDDGVSQNLLFAYSLKQLPSKNEFRIQMIEAGAEELENAVAKVGRKAVPKSALAPMIDKLKRIKCKPSCLEAAELRLTTPEWNIAWTDTNNSDQYGDLFAFLRFRKLGDALLAGELLAEYRSLAPSKLAGINYFGAALSP